MRRAIYVTALAVGVLVSSVGAAAQQVVHEGVRDEGGAGSVWRADPVTVRIYADPDGVLLFREAVRGIQGALPPKGPRLKVREEPPRDCGEVARLRFDQPTITLCSDDSEALWAGEAQLRARHHVVRNNRATVQAWWSGDLDYDRNTACHEMMHAVSWVNDDYRYDNDSCVQGERPTPGPWDVKYLASVYQDHDGKRADRRDERRDQHNGRRGGKQGGRNK